MTKEAIKETVSMYYPRLRFIRTKTHVEDNDIEAMKREFVPDESCPIFPEVDGEHDILCPLCEESFPTVLAGMSVVDAGIWRLLKSKAEGWELTPKNVRSCLCNLEMDF